MHVGEGRRGGDGSLGMWGRGCRGADGRGARSDGEGQRPGEASGRTHRRELSTEMEEGRVTEG